ncbi:IGHE protein, partial [Vireo altiloquus]|nr:IGHE protein [Vireo altiloquus]
FSSFFHHFPPFFHHFSPNFPQIFPKFNQIFPFFSPGTRLAPSVFLLPPPPEELSGPSPTLSLPCLIRGFFPDAIDVQWQKDQETLPPSRAQTL